MRKIIFLWDDDRITKVNQIFYKNKNSDITEVIFLGPVEHSLSMFPVDILQKFFDFTKKQKISVTIIISGHEKNNIFSNTINVPDNVSIECWPLYWLTETLSRMSYNPNITNNITFDSKTYDKTFEHLFICLNKKPKKHRLILLDMLAKYDCMNNNLITWREWLDSPAYETKFWQQQILLLDQKDTSKDFRQEQLPEKYDKAFMQIVSETDEHNFFMTEKTAVPLFFCKPFLVAGCKNFHITLQNFGFMLYDEIFDYSFDQEDHEVARFDKLVQNINNLKKYSKQDLSYLYKKIEHKLIYNKKLALTIATDTDNFPKTWNKLAAKNDPIFIPTNPHNINEKMRKTRIDLNLTI